MSVLLPCRQMTLKEVVIQGLECNVTAPLEVREVNRKKGRGVFALEDISRGEYLCEYRTNAVYPRAEKAKRIKEYDRNEEGSYLIETVYGRRVVFDATRKFQQVPRIELALYSVYVTCIIFLSFSSLGGISTTLGQGPTVSTTLPYSSVESGG